MTPDDTVSETEASESSRGSVDPDIRTDIETDNGTPKSADTMDIDHPGTIDEAGHAVQTASSNVVREGLNSETARRFKKQFRRRTDSKLVNVASVEDDYVLMLDSESSGDWMKRVPAERRAVLQEQRLWRIPDNWEYCVRIANEQGPDELLYKIPESSVYVVVLDLEQGGGVRSGYRVDTIGKPVVEITDMPDKSALKGLLRRVENDETDELSTEVKDALQLLLERWEHFEGDYVSYYSKWGQKHEAGIFNSEDDVTLDAWSIEPWDERQHFGHLVGDVCRVGRKVSKSLSDVLIEAGVVSPSPTITITLQNHWYPEDKPFKIGYRVQSLVEAGCSPSEAVDYLMECFQDESRASWDSNREADDSTVRENVRAARDALYS